MASFLSTGTVEFLQNPLRGRRHCLYRHRPYQCRCRFRRDRRGQRRHLHPRPHHHLLQTVEWQELGAGAGLLVVLVSGLWEFLFAALVSFDESSPSRPLFLRPCLRPDLPPLFCLSLPILSRLLRLRFVLAAAARPPLQRLLVVLVAVPLPAPVPAPASLLNLPLPPPPLGVAVLPSLGASVSGSPRASLVLSALSALAAPLPWPPKQSPPRWPPTFSASLSGTVRASRAAVSVGAVPSRLLDRRHLELVDLLPLRPPTWHHCCRHRCKLWDLRALLH